MTPTAGEPAVVSEADDADRIFTLLTRGVLIDRLSALTIAFRPVRLLIQMAGVRVSIADRGHAGADRSQRGVVPACAVDRMVGV
jgi:hypothetical protein